MNKKAQIVTAEDVVSEFLDYIGQKHGINKQELNAILNRRDDVQVIPLEILGQRRLGCMESVIKYLKENKKLTYQDIAEFTGRSRSTIGVMYHNAKKKLKEQFLDYPNGPNSMPLSQLKNKRFSALESVVLFLLGRQLRVCQIAELLNRDYRTIYTVYRRGKRKDER
jgi:hypothetical protein